MKGKFITRLSENRDMLKPVGLTYMILRVRISRLSRADTHQIFFIHNYRSEQ